MSRIINEQQVTVHSEIIDNILTDLMRGERRDSVVRKYAKLLDRKESSVQRLVREALDSIALKSDDDKEDLRALNLMRLTDLYSQSYQEKNWAQARAAIDTLNKTANLYDTNVNVSQDDTFKFEFANEESVEEQVEEETQEEEDDEESIWEG